MSSRVSIQTHDFDVSIELAALQGQDLRVGAVCSFVGTVRDTRALTGQAHDEVPAMELEHYPGMTEKSIEFPETSVNWLTLNKLNSPKL